MEKGFTARCDKGLFTFYLEQHNQNPPKGRQSADTLPNIL